MVTLQCICVRTYIYISKTSVMPLKCWSECFLMHKLTNTTQMISKHINEIRIINQVLMGVDGYCSQQHCHQLHSLVFKNFLYVSIQANSRHAQSCLWIHLLTLRCGGFLNNVIFIIWLRFHIGVRRKQLVTQTFNL